MAEPPAITICDVTEVSLDFIVMVSDYVHISNVKDQENNLCSQVNINTNFYKNVTRFNFRASIFLGGMPHFP